MAITLDARGTTRSAFTINAGHSKNTLTLDASLVTSSYSLVLPPAQGSNGQVLSLDGSGNLVWTTPSSGTPGGSTTQIQYNSSGTFAGSAGFTWTDSTQTLLLGTTTAPNIVTAPNVALSISSGTNTTGTGGALTLTAGSTGNVGSTGGATKLAAGDATGSGGGTGGLLTISGGNGTGTSTSGGNVHINGGVGAVGSGGGILFQTGTTSLTNSFAYTQHGELAFAGTAGTSGQVLTSGGAGVGPTWTTGTSGTVTSVSGSGGTTGLTLTGGPITTSGTLTLGGTLIGVNGGTGLATYTTGDTLYSSASNTLSKLAIGTTGQVLTVAGGIPSWATPAGSGTVTSVSGSGGTTGLTLTGGPITTSGTLTLGGTLAIANGGTGQTTASGAINALVPSQTGNNGKFLSSNGSVVSWLQTVTSVDGSGGTTGLSFSGGPIINTGTLTLTGTLNAVNGGTGFTTYTTGDLIYSSASNVLSKLAIGTTGQALVVTGGVPAWATPTGGGVVMTPNKSIVLEDDFMSGDEVSAAPTNISSGIGMLNWFNTNAGGAGSTITGVTSTANHPGVINITNGASSGTFGLMALNVHAGAIIATEIQKMTFVIQTGLTTSGGNDSYIGAGSGSSATWTSQAVSFDTDAVYLVHANLSSSTTITPVCRHGGSATTGTTTTIAANTWYQFDIVRNSSGNWEFYKNGTIFATISATQPTAALTPLMQVGGQNSNTGRWNFDYFGIATSAYTQRF